MDTQEKVKKHNAFMGTIAVSIVYGLVALILLLVGYFTEYGKRTILGSLSTFTATFIIGTILVIVLMTFLVIEWNPEEATKKSPGMDQLNTSSCPDYWKVEDGDFEYDKFGEYKVDEVDENGSVVNKFGFDEKEITIENIEDIHNSANENQFNLKCVADTTLFKDTNNPKPLDDAPKQLVYMSFPKTENEIDCSQVYPEYLGQLDAKEYADNDYSGSTNKYRCAYAKACSVPWTEAGCD
tara:strand:+ start:286 stop:1002 length:717 start_codon:yes stop_codon:yes gene_type:complete